MKNKYKGDGLSFYNAIATSTLKNEEIYGAMGISNGKFYNLYHETEFDEATKAAAARALGKTVKEVFGENSNDMSVKEAKKKEVIALGKHTPLRLSPDEYKKAFGDWKGLPMYNTPVTASFIEAYHDEKMFQPQYYLHDPRFRDCDFGAIITGDSMYSEIRHGDFIACKEITDRRFIVFGDIYYVVATNGLETCKYVNPDPDDRNNLLLVPRNEAISPSPIPKDMILKMYKVRGIIRGY